jgi:hypothetical protein
VVGLACAAGCADRRLGFGQGGQLPAAQEEHQPHALDAAPGSDGVTAEQLSVLPLESGCLRAPALEEALGVDDQLLPGRGRVVGCRGQPAEADDALDPSRRNVRNGRQDSGIRGAQGATRASRVAPIFPSESMPEST